MFVDAGTTVNAGSLGEQSEGGFGGVNSNDWGSMFNAGSLEEQVEGGYGGIVDHSNDNKIIARPRDYVGQKAALAALAEKEQRATEKYKAGVVERVERKQRAAALAEEENQKAALAEKEQRATEKYKAG